MRYYRFLKEGGFRKEMEKVIAGVLWIASAVGNAEPATMNKTAPNEVSSEAILKRLEKMESLIQLQQAEIERQREEIVLLKKQQVSSESLAPQRGETLEAVSEPAPISKKSEGSIVSVEANRGGKVVVESAPAVSNLHSLESSGKEVVLENGKNLETLDAILNGLTIKADLTFRPERREFTGSINSTRQRIRQRFRLGFSWQAPQNPWKFSAGIATGGFAPDTTYDTFGEDDVFETGDLRMDYAYVTYEWDKTKLDVGQQHNPYNITGLVWDPNIRPTGVSLTHHFTDELTWVVGGYDVFYYGLDLPHAYLVATQLVYQNKNTKVGASYYHYNSATSSNLEALPRTFDQLI